MSLIVSPFIVPYNPLIGLKGLKRTYNHGTETVKDFIMDVNFESYWTSITVDDEFADRKEAARAEWDLHPEKHEPIMRWLKRHGAYPGRNPYFFIQDFKVRISRTQPTNYRERPIPAGIRVFSAKYNGQWGMYTREDIDAFHMEEYKENH